jgi:hypothetical protein
MVSPISCRSANFLHPSLAIRSTGPDPYNLHFCKSHAHVAGSGWFDAKVRYRGSFWASGSMPCSILAMRSRWRMIAFTPAKVIPPITATIATKKGIT